jgi:hypothetical protein
MAQLREYRFVFVFFSFYPAGQLIIFSSSRKETRVAASSVGERRGLDNVFLTIQPSPPSIPFQDDHDKQGWIGR